jgi:hypothetical protein
MRKNNKRINEQNHRRKQKKKKTRPYKRGGGISGEEGKHDFGMVCILLNTFNA